MTSEQQRIAIAEACGWKMITIKDCGPYPHGIDPNGDRMHTAILPYYLNDLNAMHEAEKVLTPQQRVGPDGFIGHLWDIVVRDGAPVGGSTWNVCHATAAQRAEAFLRTLNLWKD